MKLFIYIIKTKEFDLCCLKIFDTNDLIRWHILFIMLEIIGQQKLIIYFISEKEV